MSRIYHPDKHNSGFTGMSDEQAVEFFQHLNNAHSCLREIMIQKKERNMKELTMNYELRFGSAGRKDIPSQSIY
jgi:DnaJ-class molecular chaperone